MQLASPLVMDTVVKKRRCPNRVGTTREKRAQILGQGLTGTTSVTFNGLPASKFTVVSDLSTDHAKWYPDQQPELSHHQARNCLDRS